MITSHNQSDTWQQIKIDGNVYTVFVSKDNDIWKVVLTNLVEIWTDTLTQKCMEQRCQELNPLLNMDKFDYIDTIISLLNNIANHVDHVSLDEIKLMITKEDGIFKFSIYLTKGSPQELWERVTKPLCLTSIELMRRHNILINLIEKKDEEIAEYKAEGAELIRRHIETKVFNKAQFKTHIPASNTITCLNAFKSVLEFYNSIDFEQPHVETEPQTISSRKSSTNKNEENSSDESDISDTNHKYSASQQVNTKSNNSKTTPRNNKKSSTVIHPKKFKKSPRDIIV